MPFVNILAHLARCYTFAMNFPIRELTKEEWPPLLHEIPDLPKKLYARGILPPHSQRILTVVGSRAVTAYGRDVIHKLIGGLRGYPITIVSGLALGVDALAHEAALDAQLHTVSVPGSGIDDAVIYPARHKRLAHRILETGGALLSEFEPTFRATPWSFPARNRIMAGMSHAVLVVEARKRSGTLITSRLATEYNRDVLTVPGSIFSAGSEGPAMLMRLGATPITTPKELLEALGFEDAEAEPFSLPPLSPEEQRIYELLTEPQSRDAVAARLNIHIAHASVLISMLEIKGVIHDSGGTLRRA
jgi:DNA processing protein